jgi:hypothetical protein
VLAFVLAQCAGAGLALLAEQRLAQP